ncbi:TonB-dependent receptor [Elizabethkingia meningoseptica]|uniref:TonB-dependent receptor domain-containing protein n=2 Tax=Elizabethkingia meningoseptica TaxID=238 RepID=UPI000332C302|nr:TonB-dependent receptor [Elizabethkingia meningoseptica]AQX05162.1 TonB-dependent receptor [Elizabethkingia meningoseptica]AQX47207.1 TonB-dependent receptor [Elizabethkingia meningoseptica]EOR29676.1 TonB-dependent receptor [Elizabethkingia meningoseptica ATCC 13253 = NBRC 12535]OPB68492.1 TonB-dependent receptor [Elizabethkingia meningoseptica]SQG05936.1 Outer membrane receptor for ferrienterochelin and colicins [Elizabethkingia meningoseptica]
MKKHYIWLPLMASLNAYGQNETKNDSLQTEKTAEISGVVVKGSKAVFQQKADKMIFNVENSVLSDGTTVLELLGKTPGVVVSQEGELSLRGKKGVSVMINGKLSSLSSKELANLLRSTNSTLVKNIEIIANPSSKYDAAGNAGIINIVLKKSSLEGLSGNYYLNGGRGRKNRFNTGISLNYTHKKLSLHGDYSYTFRGEEERKNYNQFFYDEKSPNTLLRKTEQNSVTNEPLTSNNFKFGADYAFSSNTTIGALFDAKIGRYEDFSKGSNRIYQPSENLFAHINSDNMSKENWYDYTYNLKASHSFNDKGYKADLDLEYETSRFNSRQNQLSEVILNQGTEPFNNRKGTIASRLKVLNAKLDFTLPFSEQHNLETGWKSTIKSNNNPSEYFVQDGQDWINDNKASNHYVYKEQIHALYADYKLSLKKWTFQAGVRIENTHTDINQKTSQEQRKRDYTNFFPSASIKYQINDSHGFYASYSKRINRPSHFDLNPFRFYDDPFNYWQGNPNLNPEFTHASELGYTWGKYIIASAYFSVTNDVMTEVYKYQQDTGILVKTLDNLNKSYVYGANITATVKPLKWWSLTSMFNIFNNEYKGNYQNSSVNSSLVAFTLNAQNSFTIVKGLKAEANAQYFSKSNIGLFIRDAYFDLTVGVSKTLLKDKATLKLAVTDLLKTNNYRVTGDNFSSTIRQKYNLDSRIVTLSFNYKL